MPSLDIYEALDAPDVVEVYDSLEISVSDSTQCPNVIEVLQGPPGPPGPGKIESINGQTGPNVTLTAADVSALPITAVVS